jgi:glycosyltransferase involved in cell wall biosynthesis
MIYPIFKELSTKLRRPVLVNHVHGLSAYDYATVMTEAHLGTADVSLLFKYVSGPLQIRWDELGFKYSDINILQNKRDLSYVVNKGILNVEAHIIPPAIIDPIYNAVSERNSAEVHPPSLFWFGSWENRKGAQYLPDAFRRIREIFPDCHLKIGGTGMTTEKISAFFDANDRRHISVLGSISDEEHLRLLNQSTVFLFPSLSEGFGLALLEAASQGLPAVTVSTGFAADYLRDGVNARIVYPSSLHIAQAVIDLLADPALRTTISENARSVARHFSSAEMVRRYEEVFSVAIANRMTRQIAL